MSRDTSVVLSFSDSTVNWMDSNCLWKERSAKLRNFQHDSFKKKRTSGIIWWHNSKIDVFCPINPTWNQSHLVQKTKTVPAISWSKNSNRGFKSWHQILTPMDPPHPSTSFLTPNHRFASLWIVRSILASQAEQTTSAAWRNRGKVISQLSCIINNIHRCPWM